MTLVVTLSRQHHLAIKKSLPRKRVSKVETAKLVGKAVAEKATKSGVDSVVFDRGGYLYHGRVKQLAEGAREGGLKF